MDFPLLPPRETHLRSTVLGTRLSKGASFRPITTLRMRNKHYFLSGATDAMALSGIWVLGSGDSQGPKSSSTAGALVTEYIA